MKRLVPRLGNLMLLLFLLWAGQLTAQPIHRIGKAMPDADSILPQPYLALTNANVLDVRTGEILEARTVVLQDGLIQSITTGAPPQGANVQDVNGYYVLPGFFDGHFIYFSFVSFTPLAHCIYMNTFFHFSPIKYRI